MSTTLCYFGNFCSELAVDLFVVSWGFFILLARVAFFIHYPPFFSVAEQIQNNNCNKIVGRSVQMSCGEHQAAETEFFISLTVQA
jgi:hypothetical protein